MMLIGNVLGTIGIGLFLALGTYRCCIRPPSSCPAS